MFKDGLKKSTKHLMVISTIATLLIAAIGITTTSNANAFNFGLLSKDDNSGSIDTDSLFSCVGAAINCVNENEENNNVIANNNEVPPPPTIEPGTLAVTKTVTCSYVDGQPDDQAVCDYAINQSPNFPDASDYPIAVTGNNPNPSNFAGSNSPVDVTLEAGDYTVSEVLFSTVPLQTELDATSIVTDTIFTGDCTEDAPISQSADGTIAAGESQTCNIENEIIISGGVVPTTLEVVKTVGCISHDGQPDNEAVCEYVLDNVSPEDFTLFILGNNPNPQSFEGSSSGTIVNIDPGYYDIYEQLDPAKSNQLHDDLNMPQLQGIGVRPEVSGDCSFEPLGDVEGFINSGESQVCNIENVISIRDGTAPPS
jgi:hypothetical protein